MLCCLLRKSFNSVTGKAEIGSQIILKSYLLCTYKDVRFTSVSLRREYQGYRQCTYNETVRCLSANIVTVYNYFGFGRV